MRKLALLLALWFCFSAGAAVPPPANDSGNNAVGFTLPASLKTIDESAFEGISAETVVIPDSVEIIGSRAFANNSALRTVHIAKSVRYIGDHAFGESSNVTIRGEENSYAAVWAQMHNVAFVPENSVPLWLIRIWKLLQGAFFLSLSCVCVIPETRTWQRGKKLAFIRSMRPQDRLELYPINCRFP